MIRVHKSKTPPDILRDVKERRSNSQLYTRYSNDYVQGTREFKFKHSIYGHATVKDALIQAQHGKCCYCESKMLHTSHGDVEHFRPKKGFKQQSGAPLERPGYYWLAYHWDNLYLSCTLCNQAKGNLFPLHNPLVRARSHKHSVAQEQPLFLDPGHTDPQHFIGFRGEIPYAVNGCPEGTITIEGLGLAQQALNEKRMERLQILKTFHEALQLLLNTPEGIQMQAKISQQLHDAVSPAAEFSAAAQAAVQSDFVFVL